MQPPPDPAVAIPPAARDAILDWYDATGRELSFRSTADPYAVLVSEVMAQQTQAARAAEAWTGWVARWPTAASLAAAPVADVLRAWQGLGYNRRALNLHRAARVIVQRHGGVVPSTVDELEALPGVGPYTARAVAAIAFRLPVAAVDTNVRRVLGRLAAGAADTFPGNAMQVFADAVVPRDRPDAWTHALMDLGARICRAATPRCADCPAITWCAYAAGEPDVPAHGRVPARRPVPAFPTTNRWLRGRILDRARGADDGTWVGFDEAIGSHAAIAVHEAVVALTGEGLLESREATEGLEARLPG